MSPFCFSRLFNPSGGAAVPLPTNTNPYINGGHGQMASCLMSPSQAPGASAGRPIPPQILMAAIHDRPALPPSFGGSSQPEPPNPLFRKEEGCTKSPSVSPVRCTSPVASTKHE